MKNLWLFSVLLALLAAGCGYQWHTIYREDVQTVAVPVFTCTDFRRGFEFRLTEAVIKQMESHTPYKVVPRERADTILEGQITSISVDTLSRDYNTAVPREQTMTISVDLIWKDLHDGRILLERRGFKGSAVYYPTVGEGEFAGSEEAVEKLAWSIVRELQGEW